MRFDSSFLTLAREGCLSSLTTSGARSLSSTVVNPGPLQLRNWFVMTPMTREFSPRGVPEPDVASCYARRAPPEWDSPSQRGPTLPTLRRGTRAMCQDSSEAQLEWLPEVVTQVLAAGGGSIPELCHLDGRRVPGTGPKPGVSSISPPDFPMVRLSNWKKGDYNAVPAPTPEQLTALHRRWDPFLTSGLASVWGQA